MDVDSTSVPFMKRSTWTPNVHRDRCLESYISVVEYEVLNADRRCFHKNLNFDERSALRDLKSYDDIVIKEADEGSAVVVMDKKYKLHTIHYHGNSF